MADLSSLNKTPITDLSNDEAINLILKIRQNRREKPKKYKPSKKQEVRKQNSKISSSLTPEAAREILELLSKLEGSNV